MAAPALPRTVTETRALPPSVAIREWLSALADLPFATSSVIDMQDRNIPRDAEAVLTDWADANADRVYVESYDAVLHIHRKADDVTLVTLWRRS